ncbi:zf-HC2 domain-containing protein [Roseomonas sp. NAR14]|uniref:Zf-HC2 domain-containing protein n=1 Tax=Roseomonas acroporae TaxID=2937791 RepID=A0A9X2BTQ3_9PROT|nr:zf-HC2 domain-containing protein [Roseomonas acroporae]MCK8784557.1 zf-HC2 domain-containing protein [Roseomonas acroporae]
MPDHPEPGRPGPCEDRRLLVQAELDGELDAAAAAELAVHVARCPGCAALREELGALSERLRAGLTRHAAPARLRAALAAQPEAAGPRRADAVSAPGRPDAAAAVTPAATAGAAAAPGGAAGARRADHGGALPVPATIRPSWRRRTGWTHGAAFGAGLALAASVLLLLPPPGRAPPFPEAVAAHLRALQPGHLVDVASEDRHTVKPWFEGRVDFAPPVRDLAGQGFPLVGGRLDFLDGRPVAALVYRRGLHVINLFVRPGAGMEGARSAQGYNVLAWTRDGMAFQAVSDLNAAELAQFARLLRMPEG